jgi:hypothetical protein
MGMVRVYLIVEAFISMRALPLAVVPLESYHESRNEKAGGGEEKTKRKVSERV